jgi:hypothetical protein
VAKMMSPPEEAVPTKPDGTLLPEEDTSDTHQIGNHERAGNRGIIRAFRGGGRNDGNTNDNDSSNNNNNRNGDEVGLNSNQNNGRGGPLRNRGRGRQTEAEDASGAPSVGRGGGMTLNARRGRRTSADKNSALGPGGDSTRTGLSASLHGRIGAGLRGIGVIATRGGGGSRLAASGDSAATEGDATPGDAPVPRRSRNGPKAFISSISMSGMPSRNTNRRFREMLRDTNNSAADEEENGACSTSSASREAHVSLEENSIGEASGTRRKIGGRRSSAESARSSITSLLSEVDGSEPDIVGGAELGAQEGGEIEAASEVVEKVRRSSLVRQQQRESFKEHRSSEKRRSSVSSIPEMKGIENFDDNDDADMDDAGLASIVQHMYGGGGALPLQGEEGKGSRRASVASQASGERLESLTEARASRRASIDSLRMRRASLTASLSSIDKPDEDAAEDSEGRNKLNQPPHSASKPTQDKHGGERPSIPSYASNSSMEVPMDVDNSSAGDDKGGNITKESLMANLRQLAEVSSAFRTRYSTDSICIAHPSCTCYCSPSKAMIY